MRWLARLFALAAIVALAVGGAALWAKGEFEKPGPLAEETTVQLPRGAGLNAIAAQLEDAGVIADGRIFRLGARWKDAARALKAGEYAFPPGISMEDALAKVVAGDVVRRKVTVAEGLMSVEVLDRLASAEALEGEVEGIPAEGSLAPETYLYERGDTRADVIARMQAAQRETLDALWEGRAENLPFDTKEQALVLASIVEKETGVAGERSEVAGVFVNRLRRGMPLQSDPTVIYGQTEGKRVFEGPIRRSHLDDENAWNTYRIKGLPPTPIANPGREAIAAVLNPADTDYLYFVADGTGGHAFARTLAEHNANVRKWREIERQRNAQ